MTPNVLTDSATEPLEAGKGGAGGVANPLLADSLTSFRSSDVDWPRGCSPSAMMRPAFVTSRAPVAAPGKRRLNAGLVKAYSADYYHRFHESLPPIQGLDPILERQSVFRPALCIADTVRRWLPPLTQAAPKPESVFLPLKILCRVKQKRKR